MHQSKILHFLAELRILIIRIQYPDACFSGTNT
jgi:hypothetical protein